MNWKRMSNREIIAQLGERIRERRIRQRYTQAELAKKAGITVYTMQKIEYGQSSHINTFLQVLRALDELQQLENFLPPLKISPMEMLKHQEKKVQRVRKRK